MSTEDREYGWDEAPISNPDEGGFILLPDGEYPFFVPIFERARHQGSENLPPCNMAIVHLEIEYGGRKHIVKHRLYLHSKCQGFLSQFFKGIGLRKKGEDLAMDWNKVSGSRGVVKLGNRKHGEKVFQDVKGFVEPSQQPPPQRQPPQPPAQAAKPEENFAF